MEYNLEELEEMERLMDMMKGLAKEKKFIQSASFWWDRFEKYLRDQGGHLTTLRISPSYKIVTEEVKIDLFTCGTQVYMWLFFNASDFMVVFLNQ